MRFRNLPTWQIFIILGKKNSLGHAIWCARKEKKVNLYGIVSGDRTDNDSFIINNKVEKPKINESPSNLAITGRYILTPRIFDILADHRKKVRVEKYS